MRGFHLAVTIAALLWLLAGTTAFATSPAVDWTVSYNGPASDLESVNDATVRDGFLYVVGFASLENFTKGYITVKYAPDGHEVWSRIYDGFTSHANEGDRAYGVAVDAPGNVYVTGYSAEYRIEEFEVIYLDAVTLKYSPDGELLWERRFRGSGGNVQPSAIVLDPQGFVYVGGSTWINGGFDVFLLKYDLDGNLLWSQNHGLPGERSDAAFTMALAGIGDVVLGGYTQPGDLDVYILRFGPDGSFLWEWTLHGGSNVEEVWDLTVDLDGNTYAIAQYAPVGGYTSLLTVKLDPSGTLLWSDVYSGRSTGDYARGIELAPDGNIFAAGSAWENGSQNGLTLIKYTPNGQRLWSRSERGGYYSALCYDLAVDADGAAYVTGFGFNENGREDYLTAKYDGSGNLVWIAAWDAPEGRSDISYHVRVGIDDRVYIVGDAWRDFSRYYDITSVVYRQSELVGVTPPSDPVIGSEWFGPNPVIAGKLVTLRSVGTGPVELLGIDGRRVLKVRGGVGNKAESALQFTAPSSPGIYIVRAGERTKKLVVLGNR